MNLKDDDLLKRGGVTLSDQDERARAAVRSFRALQPTLNSYARILTKRNDVSIEMAAQDNGSTDGKRIFFRPPIGLGDKTPHKRRLCDKRDAEMQLKCPACNIREDVLATIYHEIAHICYDSFERTSETAKAEVVAHAVEEAGGKYAEAIAERIRRTPSYVKQSYIALAGLISPFLPIVVNALEDARVNRELFKARRGTKIMFDANTHRTFKEGVEQVDPLTGEIKHVMWNQYPLNMQVIVGVFCKASGYDYSDWFAPKVVEALDDEELGKLIQRLDTVRSAAGVYYLSFPVLARLRELGFCKSEHDPEIPEEKSDDEGTGDSEPEAGESSDADTDGEAETSSEGSDTDASSGEESETDANEGSKSGGEGTKDDDGSVPEDDSDDSDSEPGTDGELGEDHGDPDEGESSEGSRENDSEGDTDDGTDEPSDSGGMGTSPDNESPEEEDGASGDGRTEEAGDASEPAGDEGADLDESPSEDTSPTEGDTEASGSSEGAGGDSAGLEGDDDSADLSPGGRAGAGETDDAETSPSEDGDDGDKDGGDSSGGSPETDGDEEPLDTGADDGRGGTRVIEDESNDDKPLDYGTADDCKVGLLKWGNHDEKPHTIEEAKADEADAEAMSKAILQGIYFETPSRNVSGVREHYWDKPVIVAGKNMSRAWMKRSSLTGYSDREVGIEGDFAPSEAILGPALMRMRVAFADNKRSHYQRNLRSGKVNTRVLGKRAFLDDDRLFQKRRLPGKKDYFVLIGLDISGSTIGTNLILEKRAALAQAHLLDRMGIDFAVYAHTGNWHNNTSRGDGYDLDIYHIKDPNEQWTAAVEQRLTSIGPSAANLDGHTLEYYRKVLDRSNATDKIILYYTDGKMPAENADEEGAILRREINICKQKGYTLLGVGIRTDSPIRHGLDTVRVEEDTDIVRVVAHLEKRLMVR